MRGILALRGIRIKLGRTYFDAADQAGVSRIYGGIHITADDFEGRKIGSQCGKDALALAIDCFDGSARP